MTCPLCLNSHTQKINNSAQFLLCHRCNTLFRDSAFYLSSEAERDRYLEHKNDPFDLQYQQFVSPIVEAVRKELPEGKVGLDFGAGTGPVITYLLEKEGYSMFLWDPFFHPDDAVLRKKYDFIVCCEVIEHFHDPIKEFKLMKELLKPGGSLYCMTDFLPDLAEFESWYYKDDPTHVVFYSEENLRWIQENLGFSEVTIEHRLIRFRTHP